MVIFFKYFDLVWVVQGRVTKHISYIFSWNYNTDVVKITALSGATACQIPNGKTLHSQACLNSSSKIGNTLKE